MAALPILVELFTSEGCSSCPPADALLARLHETQPAPGVQLVVMSEHVDYWNDLGWRDPFSDHLFSERQSRYGGRIYTPQAVVDGRVDVLGSDEDGIVRAAQAAAREPHGAVSISPGVPSVHLVHVRVTGLPPHGPAHVFLAVLEDSLVSKVLRGENQGRTLAYTAVVRSLTPLATLPASATTWDGEAAAPPGKRIAVFVQDRESLRVLAAASM